jgi:hypothetical protein
MPQLVPQGLQDVRWGIFLFSGMHGCQRSTMAFCLNVVTHLWGWNRQDKDTPRLAQQRLSRIVSDAGELDQSVANKGCFPDKHGLWLGMLLVPVSDSLTRPTANR